MTWQPRPFDVHEPSLRAPVPEPGDVGPTPPPADPTEHAETPRPTLEDLDDDVVT